jgi:transposase InsO family protein
VGVGQTVRRNRESGRTFKVVSIVEGDTSECLGGLIAHSITADHGFDADDDLIAARGCPAVLRSDSGPEFVSAALTDWAGTGLNYIPPGHSPEPAVKIRSN